MTRGEHERDIPDKRIAAQFRRRLLAWYDKHHRTMPWRISPGDDARKPNAYHVLVSETMLQQTQVATVEPYFHRFIDRFATIADLANADEQEVLAIWQGLGYYRRARNLHAAARRIVAEHGGRVPDHVELLLALPGVGRYTAGAIASIAFGKREPVLDGNVARVLARWFAIDEPVDDPAARERLWAIAKRLLPDELTRGGKGRANPCGDFNQALMELGALVCTPRQPRCLVCPVKALCAAAARGVAEQLPVKRGRTGPIAVEHHVLAIARAGRHVVQQRPANGLWSNMWQLPTAEALPPPVSGRAVADWAAAALGLSVEIPRLCGAFEHQTTHRRITFKLWQAGAVSGRLRSAAGVWRALTQLDDLPMSNAQRKAIQLLTAAR